MDTPININMTSVGQFALVNLIIMLYLTLRFAKGKTDNLPLVGFYTFLMCLFFFPASWLNCWYWSRKIPKVASEL